MIIIHAGIKVKSEAESEFLSAAEALVEASRAEAGNVSYSLLKSTEQEHSYTMVELWQDTEAVAAHNASGHFQSFVKSAQAYMAAPLDVRAFAGEAVQK
ncbi:putative quinol monooxygenase [Paenibacillus sp. P22]|uniref:putative quinol monooxygenase n=1 Tax=Paenibacillus sp. P22 TaxID=483908 RepID=UPI0004106AD6|nr:putative quinol monooxygenase [Paenibacillus sp. P22]